MNMKGKPHPIDIAVGKRIRFRRSQLRVSQRELAVPLGITFQQVQKYESGLNRVGSSRLKQIADFLKVAPSYFFEDKNDPPTGVGLSHNIDPEILTFLRSLEGQELNSAFYRIADPALRAGLVSLVDAASKRKKQTSP
jgi:transcriptional regulator with XRE-family HTH domain